MATGAMPALGRDGAITPTQSGAGPKDNSAAEAREGQRRLTLTGLVLYCLLQAIVGVVWDVQWHAVLGRDSFWIPPHVMLYSGITVGGLACAAFVVQETLRYYRGAPGVNNGTTVPVLGVFHAPLGLTLSGFGFLTVLFAAPFDNYWHGLYGIDVTLWAPFHVMGLLGAGIALVGLFYAWGEGLRRTAGAMGPRWVPQGGLLGSLAVLLIITTGLLAEPAVWEHPLLSVGGGDIAVYPLLVSPTVACALIVARWVLPWRAAATALAILFTVLRLVLAWVVPPVMQLASGLNGDVFRDNAPTFAVIPSVLPALLILYGLIVDGLFWLVRRRWSRIPPWGPPLAGALVGLALSLLDSPWTSGLRDNGISAATATAALVLTAPLAVMLGALGGAIGGGLGATLQRRLPPAEAMATLPRRIPVWSLARAGAGIVALFAVPVWIVVAPPPEMADTLGWALGLSPLIGILFFGLSQWQVHRQQRHVLDGPGSAA